MMSYRDGSSVNKPVINHYHNDLNQPAELFDVCSTPRIKMQIGVWFLSSLHSDLWPINPRLQVTTGNLQWTPQEGRCPPITPAPSPSSHETWRKVFWMEFSQNGVLCLYCRVIKKIFLVRPFKSNPQWPWELAKRDTFQEEYLHNKISKRWKAAGEGTLKCKNSRCDPKI